GRSLISTWRRCHSLRSECGSYRSGSARTALAGHRLHLRLVLLDVVECRSLLRALEQGDRCRAVAVPQVLEAIQRRRAAGLGQTPEHVSVEALAREAEILRRCGRRARKASVHGALVAVVISAGLLSARLLAGP